MPLSRSLQAAAAAALIALASGCANSPPPGTASSGASVASALCAMGFSSVPMRALSSGHHIAEVTLNGKPGTFVVDTGAGATVIHAPYAQNFALAQGAEVKGGRVVGTGGAQGLQQFGASEFRVGGTRTGLTTIYGTDLSNVVKFLDPLAGTSIQGVVGQDVMRAQHAIVDIQQSRLYLRPIAGEPARCDS